MENTKENRLGTQPIGSLVLSMSAPIMISMLVQALYNIVDTIYVTQYAQTAPESTEMYINATAMLCRCNFNDSYFRRNKCRDELTAFSQARTKGQ